MIRKLVICFFVVAFLSCQREGMGLQKKWREDNGKIKILATIAMIGDLARQIAGEEGDVLDLIGGDLDPHSYQLVKGDSEKLAFADLILALGVGLEHGASLKSALSDSNKTLFVGEKIWDHYPEKRIHYRGQRDPHLWEDVSLWAEMIPYIVESLAEIRPEKKELFLTNGKTLSKKLNELHGHIFHKIQSLPENQRYLVTSHDAFNYFSRAYLASADEVESELWRKRAIAPQGLAPESQIATQDLLEVIHYILEHKVRVLFFESNVSRDALAKIEAVLEEKGWTIRMSQKPLFGDSMGGNTYEKMMDHNADVIYEGLL